MCIYIIIYTHYIPYIYIYIYIIQSRYNRYINVDISAPTLFTHSTNIPNFYPTSASAEVFASKLAT